MLASSINANVMHLFVRVQKMCTGIHLVARVGLPPTGSLHRAQAGCRKSEGKKSGQTAGEKEK